MVNLWFRFLMSRRGYKAAFQYVIRDKCNTCKLSHEDRQWTFLERLNKFFLTNDLQLSHKLKLYFSDIKHCTGCFCCLKFPLYLFQICVGCFTPEIPFHGDHGCTQKLRTPTYIRRTTYMYIIEWPRMWRITKVS